MRYEIKGGVFPIVVCYLEAGEKMITEKALWYGRALMLRWKLQEEVWEKCFLRLFPEKVCSRIFIRLREDRL